MGKHAQIGQGRKAVSVLVATSRRGLSKPLRGQESKGPFDVLAVPNVHKAADVTRPPLPEIWDDRARSKRASSLRGSPENNTRTTCGCSRKRQRQGHAVCPSSRVKPFARTRHRSTRPEVLDPQTHGKGKRGSSDPCMCLRQHSKRTLRRNIGKRCP